MKKSTLLHLRIPFSYYLLPVYLFALCIAENIMWENAMISFCAIHFFLYPASNGYNSFFDKDTESIGGLRKPPPVTKELYYVSLAFDLIAILLGLMISIQFSVMLFVYGLISKAYSHPAFRLKKYPVLGWLAAGIFQGYFTLIMSYTAITGQLLESVGNNVHFAGILSTVLLMGSYPMTQIYQHKADESRGDQTISMKLGILGTFHFTAIIFTLTMFLFGFYFVEYYSLNVAIIFVLALTPVLIYFGHWYLSARKEINKVNFDKTMQLNFLSATALNLFFLWLGFI